MLTERAAQILQRRGLEPELMSRFGWSSKDDVGTDVWIEIPFFVGTDIVNRKSRTIAGEKKFYQEANARKVFWNFNALTDSTLKNEPVIITEGEIDALTAIQCGYSRTVSVPDGAPATALGDRDTEKYSYIADALPLLKDEREIILAVDGDAAGNNLLHDLALRLGNPRCKWVRYPKGRDGRQLKDLNEAFMEYGVKGVTETLRQAKYIKTNGAYKMSDLPPFEEQPVYRVGFPGLDERFGVRRGDFIVVTGAPSGGKALALDTPIPTISGFKPMRDIHAGDVIFDETGKPCAVLGETPVMIGRPCYEVTFGNGETVIADAEHEWLTNTERARQSATKHRKGRNGRKETKLHGTDQQHLRNFPEIVTTEKIADTVVWNGKVNHQIRLAGAVEYPSAELPVDPYLLGAWLGDGASKEGSITTRDQGVLAEISGAGYEFTRRAPLSFTIRKAKVALRAVNVLANKHIPDLYQHSSPEQRLSLLQGLMDTDGYCSPLGKCEFTSVNQRLAMDVCNLISSLGIKARICVGIAKLNGRAIGPKYRVIFYTLLPVFRLQRKLDRMPKKISKGQHHKIVSCEPVASVPVKCIQVDSPSRLYLATHSFIPTHNSTFLTDIACRMASNHGWKTAFASFEQHPRGDHCRSLTKWFYGWGHSGNPTRWIDDNFVFLVPDDDDLPNLDWFLTVCEMAVIQHGADMICCDPWNQLSHIKPDNMTLTEYVGFAIKQLKRFAKKFNVCMVVAAHPAKMSRDREGKIPTPGLYDISDSAHFANAADIGLVVHRANREINETEITIAKIRYQDIIGTPGVIKVQFLADQRRFQWIDQ